MSTYVIGDVQGCLAAFHELLQAIDFKPRRDRLWLAGDLINRGEDSIGMLRWCMAHDDSLVAILGNHDLHLLAVAEGFVPVHRHDTLDDILEAPDREAVLTWLRHRPMVYREGDWLMVHAGLMPEWSADAACALGQELEAALRGPDWRAFLREMYGNEPRHWSPLLKGQERLRVIANAMTRLRYVHADGGMEFLHKCAPAEAPEELTPWFDVPGRQSAGTRIFFGHWSTLGLYQGEDVMALDSGCLWGGQLSAYRLDDGRLFQVGCHARQKPKKKKD